MLCADNISFKRSDLIYSSFLNCNHGNEWIVQWFPCLCSFHPHSKKAGITYWSHLWQTGVIIHPHMIKQYSVNAVTFSEQCGSSDSFWIGFYSFSWPPDIFHQGQENLMWKRHERKWILTLTSARVKPALTQAQLSCISVWHSLVSPLLSNTGSNWLQGSGRGITLPFFGPTYYYIWAWLLWCRALVPQVMFEALKWALLLWHRIGWAKFGYSGV